MFSQELTSQRDHQMLIIMDSCLAIENKVSGMEKNMEALISSQISSTEKIPETLLPPSIENSLEFSKLEFVNGADYADDLLNEIDTESVNIQSTNYSSLEHDARLTLAEWRIRLRINVKQTLKQMPLSVFEKLLDGSGFV